MQHDQPLNLDAIEARAAHLYEYAQQTGEGDTLAGTDIPAMAAEIRRLRADEGERQAEIAKLIRWHGEDDTAMQKMRGTIERLRAELASAREQAIHWAAETTDAKLTAEPDHNRASALYELLLQLRGKLPCTCARSQGLHEKGCRRYVPGHELLSPVRALAAYRSETAAEETHVVADDSDNPEHTDDCPGCQAFTLTGHRAARP